MMPEKTFPYTAVAHLDDDTEVQVDLEERGWADKALLARTTRWTLLPKDGAVTLTDKPWPFIVVNIPPRGRPVFKSRWYGALGANDSANLGGFRVFAAGFKVGGKTHLTWVLPTGDIETGTDSPWLADLLWHRMFSGESTPE